MGGTVLLGCGEERIYFTAWHKWGVVERAQHNPLSQLLSDVGSHICQVCVG